VKRPFVQEEVAVVYRAVGVDRERRYLTERAAFRAVAMEMVRRKYPEDFQPRERDHATGYFDPPRTDHTKLINRLARKLTRGGHP
jgi:hypothetical protein